MEQIFGIVERITFRQDDTGFTVARLKQPRKTELTTIVGTLPHLSLADSVRLQGVWKKHPAHGLQFDVHTLYFEAPKDCEGIEKYLSSGTIKGIGPAYAKKIVAKFKEQTLDVIEHTPDRLLCIEGIGEKKLESIIQSWKDQMTLREVMLFLQKYDVSPAYARKIFRRYGQQTIDHLKENPYAMATDIAGIGFKIADTIAEKMGFPKDSQLRIDAGVIFALNELSMLGHTCYPKDLFCEKATQLLQAPIEESLQRALAEGKFIEKEGFLALRKYWVSEGVITFHINRIKNAKSTLRAVDMPKALDWVEKTLHLQLAEAQKVAVAKALSEKVLIITGGPGTGKSTITKAILALSSKLTSKIVLAAPTGRAAKRMTEITKKEAQTLHALLKFDFKTARFTHNKDNPITCDLIIIDEASMIDTALAASLLSAIPSHARVLIVGDVNQLPSVGPGRVLHDLIASDSLPVITLNEIFRQAAGSRIITNAHLVNKGQFPDLSYVASSDFFFSKSEQPEELLDKVVELVTKKLSKRFDPIWDIQVLAPMKKGAIGIDQLNVKLQQALNPQASLTARFSVGDKVMQLRNDYDKEVYNGDIGQVVKIDEEWVVNFDGKEVAYDSLELEDLTLAYATSVHKYQGSEAPCVIIVVHPSHYMMLQRNLLYTAITRGKKMVLLVGTAKAIAMAVGRNEASERHTFLVDFLKEGVPILEKEAIAL